MADIVTLPCYTRNDIPAHRVIDNIPEDMQTIVVIGRRADGEGYAASSTPDAETILELLSMLGEFIEGAG